MGCERFINIVNCLDNNGEKIHGNLNIEFNEFGQCLLDGEIANGNIIVNDKYEKEEFFDCLAYFDELAHSNNCGAEYYDQIAYCSKVNFFGRYGVKGALPVMERNNPKTINEKQKNYMQDKVLVLIDGCFKCDSSDENVEINIKLIQDHPGVCFINK
uniref:Uncharacterized protein n=1 Tax=Meloidogyne enterolobii TaxID=390850 RepID=A0A6V7U351_MELEN|nr:unnamed protein product [Meloidogyne enterolobii]